MHNDKHEWLWSRLKETASQFQKSLSGNKSNECVAVIEFNLYFCDGSLIGWNKPRWTPLEPFPFDLTVFNLRIVRAGWNDVFVDLKQEKGDAIIRKALVIRGNGEPVGWFTGMKTLELT